jgi:DNA-3-methyladenine glycosylase
MMNIVAHEEGQVGGVLLRAVEPLDGIELMEERRNGVGFQQLGKGPGSLGQAMGIRLSDIGSDLMTTVDMALHHGQVKADILAGPRIGISKAIHAPWRFFEYPCLHVSSHKRGKPVTRDEVPFLIPPPGIPIE